MSLTKKEKAVPRLLKRITKTESGCWLWNGGQDGIGYGVISFDGKAIRTHRLSYLLFVGDIGDGKYVLHKCDVRHCINPDHLFLGTHAENMGDKIAKGRQTKGSEVVISKLTEKSALEILKRYGGGETISALAREFRVAYNTVGALITGHTWKHVHEQFRANGVQLENNTAIGSKASPPAEMEA